MQLSTLERYDAKTANAILAAAALSQQDTPYLSASEGKYDTEVSELISELESQLNLSRDDEAGRKKLRAYLSDKVRTALLGGNSVENVQSRLGQRGDLPISSYRLKLGKEVLKDFHESKKTVEAAINSPDEVQHFVGSGPFSDTLRGVTLVTKWVPSKDGEAHWLLADAQRQGDSLYVQAVLRISPSRLDLSAAESPLDLLRVFVERYGVEFTVEGVQGGHKFVCDLEVPSPPNESTRKLTKPKGFAKYLETGYSVNEVDDTTKEVLRTDQRIVVAYAVDMTTYLAEKPRA
jgi:hypothetical protein